MRTIRTLFSVVLTLGMTANAEDVGFTDESPSAPPFPPITDGLILDMDASVPSTLFENDDGLVTNWVSKVGSMSFGAAPSDGTLLPGFRSAAGFGGRGSVVLGRNKAGAAANSFMLARSIQTTPARTHMIVWSVLGGLGNNGYASYSYGYSDGSGADTANHNEGLQWDSHENPTYISILPTGSRAYLGEAFTFGTGFRNGCVVKQNTAYTFTIFLPETLATSANLTSKRYQVLGSWRWTHSVRNLPVEYGEVMNWSRQLTSGEWRYMQCYLTAKWHPEKTLYVWTGEGDGESWDDGANWKDGVIPSADGLVFISSEAEKAIKVSGAVSISYLILRDVQSIQVQAGASFAVTDLISVKGQTEFSAGVGSKFSHAFVHKWPGSTVSFELDDATLVVETPSFGKCFRDAYEYGRPYPLECQPHELQAGPVAGTGRFVVAVGGVHRMSPDCAFPDGLACTVASGGLDLNGKNISVTTLAGAGFVTNSAATRATVTVTGADQAEVRSQLLAGVDICVKDVDEATFGGGQGTCDGTVKVDNSALKVEEDLRPAFFTDGIVWHVDASRRDSFEIDSVGRLTKVYSCSPERMVFTKYGSLTPLYSATGMEGKPTFLFAVKDNGTYDESKSCSIQGDVIVSNRTIAVAFRPFKKMPYYAWHGLVCNGGVQRSKGGNIGSPSWQGIQFNQGQTPTRILAHAESGEAAKDTNKLLIYHNGACVRDDLAGIKNAVTNRSEVVQVVIAAVQTFSNAIQGYNANFNPLLGAKLNQATQSYGGALSEAMAFDRVLTHDEMKKLSAYLMRKWGAEPLPDEGFDIDLPSAKDQLPVNGTLAIDGATVDLGGFTNHVAKLVTEGSGSAITNGTLIPAELDVRVSADGQFAKVSGDADWDIAGTALKFVGFVPKNGMIIQTSGSVEGSFVSFDPAKMAGKVKSDGQTVKVSNPGLVLIVR